MVMGLLLPDAPEQIAAEPQTDAIEDLVVWALERIASDREPLVDRVALVKEAMRTALSDRVRNAAALSLIELDSEGAKEALQAVLQRENIAKSAGTLLFALNEVGGALPLGMLTYLLQFGSFEARNEVLTMIEDGRFLMSDENQANVSRQVLRNLAENSSGETAEAAESALDLLDGLEPKR